MPAYNYIVHAIKTTNFTYQRAEKYDDCYTQKSNTGANQ